MAGGHFPKAELKQPLPAALLDASTWTIPCPSVLLMLMAEHDTREAVAIWGQGLITMNKHYAEDIPKKARAHWDAVNLKESSEEHSHNSDNAAA